MEKIEGREGRAAFENSAFQYEFFINDHLGNVRQVLRNPTANARIATMEQANAEEEESQFTQIKPTRRNEPKHNVTSGGKDVAWLNASRGEMVGPGTSQEIFEGDSVTLSVHGKFLDRKKQKVNLASFATTGGRTALLDQLNELALNTSRAGGANPIAVLNLVDILAKDLQKKETPEAYLIYALYDGDSNRYEVGKKVLTRNAANQHEELEEKIAIKKNGYIETFVVNETGQDVWFDNMMVMSISSVIVQETHYDPWGLELTGLGFQYGGIKANKYLYNGKELIEDNGLQYYDYGARMYDATIGRWGVVDPMSEKAPSLTPYRYGFNNPLTFTDPTGMFEYVKGGYGEDIEMGNVFSHSEDGGYRSDAKRGENEHGKVVWAGMNFSVNSEGKRNSRIHRYFEYEDGTTRNISYGGGFRSKASGRNQVNGGSNGGSNDYFSSELVTGLNVANVIRGNFELGGAIYYQELTKGGNAVRLADKAAYNGLIKYGRILGRAGYGLTAGVAIYEVANGKDDTHTWVDVGITGLGVGAVAIFGTAAAPVVAVGALGYGIWSIAGGSDWINSNWGYRQVKKGSK